MLETRDQKRPLLHQKKAILLLNSTCAIYNVILNTLALRIFTFVIYCVRQICARRPQAGEHCTPFFRQMHLILLQSEE